MQCNLIIVIIVHQSTVKC